jgi:Copper resistance protein D
LVGVLPRSSKLAMGAVITLVVTGTYLGWRDVGTLKALPTTAFGQLLLAKLVAVAVLLAVADLARRWVRRRADRTGPASVPVFRTHLRHRRAARRGHGRQAPRRRHGPARGRAPPRQRAVGRSGRGQPVPHVADLGPLPVRVGSGGGGSGAVDADVSYPAAGDWTLRLTVRTGPLDSTAPSVAVPVS